MIISFWEFRRSWISMLKDLTSLYLLFWLSCYRLYQYFWFIFFIFFFYIFVLFCKKGFTHLTAMLKDIQYFISLFDTFCLYQLCCILQEKVLLFWRLCYGLFPFSWILSLNILTSAYRLPTMNGRQDCHKTLKCIQGFFKEIFFTVLKM